MSTLTIGEAGVVGWVGDRATVDVHNRDHPQSKNNQKNGVSIGFTAHYRAMRQVFGAHVTDGIAGENILVDSDVRVSELDLTNGLNLESDAGTIVKLDRFIVAEPCVEFSRYALANPEVAPDDSRLRDALAFLREGTRGFYATYRGAPARVSVGDRVVIP